MAGMFQVEASSGIFWKEGEEIWRGMGYVIRKQYNASTATGSVKSEDYAGLIQKIEDVTGYPENSSAAATDVQIAVAGQVIDGTATDPTPDATHWLSGHQWPKRLPNDPSTCLCNPVQGLAEPDWGVLDSGERLAPHFSKVFKAYVEDGTPGGYIYNVLFVSEEKYGVVMSDPSCELETSCSRFVYEDTLEPVPGGFPCQVRPSGGS
jgi:hypothetical protein